MVVSNIGYFHPYLGKIPILTSIFFKGVETTNQSWLFAHGGLWLPIIGTLICNLRIPLLNNQYCNLWESFKRKAPGGFNRAMENKGNFLPVN